MCGSPVYSIALRIRQLVHLYFHRMQNHESQHQKRPQHNIHLWCTGLDVLKLASIQQSREAHPCLQHVSHLTKTMKIFKK